VLTGTSTLIYDDGLIACLVRGSLVGMLRDPLLYSIAMASVYSRDT